MEAGKHFVLVHGACHGAWTWYKITALLEQAGHRVTAVDLGASSRRPEKLSELKGFADYAQPLIEVMEALPTSERVIIVGHSFGGLPTAWAMERFPEKVSAGVFAAAFMPDSSHPPSYPLDEYFAKLPPGFLLDTQVDFDNEVEDLVPTLLFGPAALTYKLYQNSPPEDLVLGKSMVRISSLFMKNLARMPKFSEEGYGSVSRVYILSKDDLAIPEFHQHWMLENYPATEVKEMITSDHMLMLSKPQELFNHLLDIARVYS